MADNTQPKSTPPWVPQSNSDDAVQIAAFQQRMNRAAILASSGATQPPFPHFPAAATALGFVTKQEQPDHQDPPTESPPPSAVVLEAETGAYSLKGNDAELTLHDEMLRRVATLEKAMAQLAATKPGIGHNDPVPFDDDDRRVVETAIVMLRAQSPAPDTPPVEAGEAAVRLMTIGEQLRAYAIRQGEVFVSEAVKSAGTEAGKRFVQAPFWLSLAGLLYEAAKATFAWIASLPTLPH